MSDAVQALGEVGGIAYMRQLARLGVSENEVARSLEAGSVIRLRRGLVALAGTDRQVTRAARVGGRLAGRAAAEHRGIWSPPGPLTVAVPEHTGRLWHPDRPGPLAIDDHEVRVLRDTGRGLPRFGVSTITQLLSEVCLSEPSAFAVAVGDSALRRSPTSMIDLLEVDARLPPRAQGVLSRCDARADSGTESILRTALQDAGLDPRIQVRVPFTDLDRLDMVLGDRLVIETDSRAHHSGEEQRLRDLHRDATLATLGFIVLRFDYQQVLFELDDVLAAVLRYVDLGLHLDPSRSREGIQPALGVSRR